LIQTRSASYTKLDVDPVVGLSAAEAAARLAHYGPNQLSSEKTTSLWRQVLQAFSDPMVNILLVAGAIFIALGERTDGTTMMLATIPLIVVDLVLGVRTERTLDRLRQMASPRALVRRDGRETVIPGTEVVPGDVVLLKEGEIVPADGIIESESNFQVDESTLTGESLPVSKKGIGWPALGAAAEDRESRAFAGTTVLAGRSTVIATATGADTEYGEIGALVARAKPSPTHFERSVRDLVRTLSVVAVFASLALAGIVYAAGQGWVEALLAGVSLAIAAIPEEFPIIFAIYLAIGAWRMARRNALVRRLAGVETLGSTSVICTDKTGTLTQGKLAVRGIHAGGQLQIGDVVTLTPLTRELLEDALLASEPNPFDPLDQAIATVAKESGVDPPQLYSRWSMAEDYPFDPDRKYVTHVWRSPQGKLKLASKGAIEGILELSLPAEPEREAALRANQELTSTGMRVIAVASKELSRLATDRWANESGMRLVGLIGFADPLREGVSEAVAGCQSAGVRVIMITGDHPLTAHAIAEAAGIMHDDESILTGAQMEQLGDEELKKALGSTAIFARTQPAQKYRIVQGLKARRDVVAMTGDGINDAPALRVADIGVAMGRRGTQVAREAATMVLLDDNFGTIVEAIKEGRRIFDNLQRAFVYLIIFHFPIVLGALLIPLVGAPLLLLPTTLVWLEVIVHPTAALVFVADPPDPDLMDHPPRSSNASFFQPGATRWVIVEGTAMLLGVIGIYLGLLWTGTPLAQARACGMITLVVGQSLLVLQARSTTRPFWQLGFLTNKAVIPAILATLLSLGLFIYLPPLAAATQLAPPAFQLWLLSIGVALACTLALEPVKLK
jgi:P-type Ca2+ transporter type 2C